MIRHIVLIRFVSGADQAAIGRYSRAVEELPNLIPEIVDFSCGRDVGKSEGLGPSQNWDFFVSSTFRNFADYLIYAEHPQHKALVDRYLVGLMSERAALQVESPADTAWRAPK